jgi:hypothetical protein
MAADPGQTKIKGNPRAEIATPDFLRRAIEGLTVVQAAKLKAFSASQARRVQRYVPGLGEYDLLQEAVMSLLQCQRSWKPDQVEFIGMLMGAMRSIASNLSQKGKDAISRPILEFEATVRTQAGEQLSILELAVDSRQNPQVALLKNELPTEEQLVSEIERLFEHDTVASLIINGWKNGMKGPEIAASLEISKKEYHAAVQRIRRATIARWPEGKPYVQ